MSYNSDRRKKRLIQARDYNFDYKFNNEATSYDRIMTVLNKQQERIVAMLKKYTDDDPNLADLSQPTMQLESIEGDFAKRNASTLNMEDRGFRRVEGRRRVDSSLPIRKKVQVGNRQGVYNLYDIGESLPMVKHTARSASKKHLSLGSSDRRSKQEVIEQVYVNKVQPKSKPKKKLTIPSTPTQLPESNTSTPLQPAPAQLGESSDSDVEEPVALPQYYKEFRETVRKQVVEEMNFLYFSKDEPMKNWTESILTMFEKHDKEVRTLRKKAKYLETFDEHYFATDAFIQ